MFFRLFHSNKNKIKCGQDKDFVNGLLTKYFEVSGLFVANKAF